MAQRCGRRLPLVFALLLAHFSMSMHDTEAQCQGSGPPTQQCSYNCGGKTMPAGTWKVTIERKDAGYSHRLCIQGPTDQSKCHDANSPPRSFTMRASGCWQAHGEHNSGGGWRVSKQCHTSQNRNVYRLITEDGGGGTCDDLYVRYERLSTENCVNDDSNTGGKNLVCKRDCKLGEWTPYSACDGRIRFRTKAIVQQAQHGGSPCPAAREEMPCSHCSWNPWGNWAEKCSPDSKARRTRTATLETNGGNPCTGAGEESRKCVDCVAGEWLPWGDCDGTSRQREREILTVNSGIGSKPCPKGEVQPCQDCKWSPWGEYGRCVRGRSTRSRAIAVLRENGGKKCRGPVRNSRTCDYNKEICYSACPISRRTGETGVSTTPIIPTMMRPLTQWGRDHPAAKLCGSNFSGADAGVAAISPPSQCPGVDAVMGGELLYWYNRTLGRAMPGLLKEGVAAKQSATFAFVVDSEGGTSLVCSAVSPVKTSTVVEVSVVSGETSETTLRLLDDPDEDNARCLRQGKGGDKTCLKSRVSLSYGANVDDPGDGFSFGPLDSYSSCVDIELIESSSSTGFYSYSPGANSPPVPLFEIGNLGSVRICANDCRKLGDNPLATCKDTSSSTPAKDPPSGAGDSSDPFLKTNDKESATEGSAAPKDSTASNVKTNSNDEGKGPNMMNIFIIGGLSLLGVLAVVATVVIMRRRRRDGSKTDESHVPPAVGMQELPYLSSNPLPQHQTQYSFSNPAHSTGSIWSSAQHGTYDNYSYSTEQGTYDYYNNGSSQGY